MEFLPEKYSESRNEPQNKDVLVIGSQNKSLLLATIPLTKNSDNTLQLGEQGITLSAVASDVCGAIWAVHRYGRLLEDGTHIPVALSTFVGGDKLGRKYVDAHLAAGIPVQATKKMLKDGQTSGLEQDLQIDFVFDGIRIGSQTPYQNLDHAPMAFALRQINLDGMLQTYPRAKVFIAGGAPGGPTNPGYVGLELAKANARSGLHTVADLKNRLDSVGFMAVISNADYVHLNKDEAFLLYHFLQGEENTKELESAMRSYGGQRFEDDPRLAIDLYSLCQKEGIMRGHQTWVVTTKQKVHVIQDDYIIEAKVPDLTDMASSMGGSDAGAGNNVTGAIAAAIVKEEGLNKFKYMAKLGAIWGMMGAIGPGAIGATPHNHYSTIESIMKQSGSVEQIKYQPNIDSLDLRLRL
jgi:hypothetical protein